MKEIGKKIDGATTFDGVRTVIREVTGELEKRWTEKKKSLLPEEIQSLIMEREKIKRSKKSQVRKIELNGICKLVKRKLREYETEKKYRLIEDILEDSGSTRKIGREISLGKKWISYLLDNEGRKITSREGISKVATEFHAEYSKSRDPGAIIQCRREMQMSGEQEPEFLVEEVEFVVRNLKSNNASGSDNIINEQIRLGGEKLIKKLTEL